MNKLYFGDNLSILSEYIASESVDLIYLDPPFNSKRDYNLLFKTPKGHSADAQITAFEDSWHWGAEAEKEYTDLFHQTNTELSEVIRSLRKFLGENDMMAYLVMMASRLLQLHRVLKPTGSLYLHCDPSASHYLKIVLDGVFGKENFKNEINWLRTNTHNDATRKYPNITDSIHFYTKSDSYTFNQTFKPYDEDYLKKFYRHTDDKGVYSLGDLTNTKPGGYHYEYKGYNPNTNGWRCPLETMQRWDSEGLIYFPNNKDGRLRIKRYLDRDKGTLVGDTWTDVQNVQGAAAENLGYPTQKPLALLERIVNASSNEGDIVLDPFCGCGTAVHAAQKLNRKWIGIDITHLAITLIEKRLRDAFPAIEFEVEGTPKDYDSARNLAERDKYQFQWWACSLVNAQPFQGKKKGADGGIDGLIYFQDDNTGAKKIVVSVKGGDNISVAMIRDLAHVVEREKAEIGLFITLVEPTRPMVTEAVSTGFYTSYNGKNYPKVQILTIEGLIEKTQRAEYPDLTEGTLTHKKAQKEKKLSKQVKLL